jgi:hypothetical protein
LFDDEEGTTVLNHFGEIYLRKLIIIGETFGTYRRER